MTFPLEQVSSHRDEEWLVRKIQCPLTRTAARASLSCPECVFFICFTCFLTQSFHLHKIMLKAVIYTEKHGRNNTFFASPSLFLFLLYFMCSKKCNWMYWACLGAWHAESVGGAVLRKEQGGPWKACMFRVEGELTLQPFVVSCSHCTQVCPRCVWVLE